MKFVPKGFSVGGASGSLFDELVFVVRLDLSFFVGHTFSDGGRVTGICILTGRTVMSDRGGETITCVGMIFFINSDTYQFVGHKSIVHGSNASLSFHFMTFNLVIEIGEVLDLKSSNIIIVEDNHVASVVDGLGRAYNT